MCRASARGCTVIPGAPASTHTPTASMTDGIRPPRELRTVATLLTFTDRRTNENSQLPNSQLPTGWIDRVAPIRFGNWELVLLGVYTVTPTWVLTASMIS